VSVIVTAQSGFDLGYVWKGAGQEPERSADGYYMNAAQAGEAPGRWFGRGAAALGLAGKVDRDKYDAVYAQVNPQTGEQLGRKAPEYEPYQAILARLMEAEPQATTERLLDLEREARRQTRQAAPYTDVTVSFAKSISVVHASIRENARLARQAGDLDAAAWWDGRELAFQQVLQDANRAALEHAQRWAVTRTGYHGARVHGRETGRWDTAGTVVSSWLQGTSRDGDPQDHVHNQFARTVQADGDGCWRALDTAALKKQLPEMAAVAAAHVEAGLAREFGVRWVARPDGKGHEIAGITQAEMDAYSSRTEAIKAATPELVDAWTQKYGRAPNQRELQHIQQYATMATRAGKEDGEIDWDDLARHWDEKLGGTLARIAPRVAQMRAGADAHAAPREGDVLSAEAQAAAVRKALARIQQRQPTWTRADLTRQLKLCMPAELAAMEPEAAVALVQELAGRAIAGEFEPVVSLDAPEWPVLPAYLRRELDGRSIYTRPGTQVYATRVQLTMEERLLQQAQALGAPTLNREQAAELLGADLGALESVLRERGASARSRGAASGLRMDQAAALHYVLTSPRTAEVLVGPAGSGKTLTLAEASRAWISATGAQVIGLATAQAARNVLAEAGVDLAENTSVFLGHLPGKRGALGITALEPGSLIVIDEASMMSTMDLADILVYARMRGCKVIVAGDQEQLTAVEGGGGMILLARELGHVQLAEAVRFRAEWEQEASLGLRAGDVSALEAYDDHGRISGGDPDEAMEAARAAYVSHHLAGTDVELIAWERDRCAELSRRVRDDLVHLGLVDAGREVSLADGARAGTGDLIIARGNDKTVTAGEPGRTLANGDVLRIEAISADGTLTVRRAAGRAKETGQRQWADSTFAWRGYSTAELAYATTAHSAQGRTVTVGLAVVTGAEHRQWLYSAMTRGAESNRVFAFTISRNVPDPSPGTCPAPELARHERLEPERAGLPAQPRAETRAGPQPRDALAVLADVLVRDGSEASATETLRQALADADNLAVLNAVWQGETAGLKRARYREIVEAALPPNHDPAELDTRQARWLWRTMRAAETAGLDVEAVTRDAIASRSLTGVHDLPSVIDARLRQATAGVAPVPVERWSEQVPQCGGERQHYLTQLAAMMDERKVRLGEQAALEQASWAVIALGPVPGDPLARLEWQQRASHIAAYRELYGWDHDSEPCGPEPTGDSPDKRAAWHAAYGAMTRTDEARLSAVPDGSLHHMRDTYAAETAWAPPHVGAELRQVRAAGIDMAAAAACAVAAAAAARQRGDDATAARHDAIARSARAAGEFYSQRAALDEGLMADRAEWSQRTAGSRHLAILADSELRRRHPDLKLEPLVSHEPEPAPAALPAITGPDAVAEHAAAMAQRRNAFRAALEERLGLMVPAEDPDHEDEGEAWPAWQRPDRDAVLQPPKPELRPSQRVIKAAAPEHAGFEAGQ
jgi:hypothetical protein